ncbi:rhomboid family intramembrane serine protease [Jannaschia sp. W003]|uniref:rhomboid family intramembrane serine protease n=1 Tax=Jannaschia sp. W003 TaxID=2867012 RepID=UPI0021A6ADDB|nr:rhomboid family intramembrane serine protease [Jannaschia sp. W003]UWQ22194.1 rhomboid family intramembrane serine protease [Jannaschia sp. W003]
MHPDPRNQSPFHALPPVVAGLALVIGGVEAMFLLAEAGLLGGPAGDGWRIGAIRDWSVAGPVWDWMVANGRYPPEYLARFATYALIHGGIGHAAFVAVFVLALGNVTHPFLPRWRQLAVFFGSAVAGGLAFAVLFDGVLYGGFPGAYGLIGAFTYLTWRGVLPIPRERAFLLVGLLLVIQPVFALAAGMGWGWLPDWVAEAVGAAAGFGLSAALAPGALARMRDRMRRR